MSAFSNSISLLKPANEDPGREASIPSAHRRGGAYKPGEPILEGIEFADDEEKKSPREI